ncbi:hypothetical protein ACHHYP_05021 [Achlya hypogyna]|uniref:Phospholipid/glycerol acyltransferase domain-containing protein n=1 Tax=Achlya hypogyna TaxID=1202772 RepID=A0A1V9YZC9_ACHHY|nr:hypothetical protein ACHHYP_05021 [Achlya hypogyna]
MEAKLLRELTVDARLAAVEAKVQTFLAEQDTLKLTTTLAERNHMRRSLHAESEYILLDLEEALLHEIETANDDSPTKSISDDVTLSKDEEMIAMVSRFHALRKLLTLEVQPEDKTTFEKTYMIVRLASFAMLFFGGFAIFFFLIPLRWTHITLRKMGVKNNYLPVDFIQWWFGWALCAVGGIHVMTEGTDNVRALNGASTVMMFSHGSNLDGLMIQGSSPTVLKFIGKKSLFLIPIVGWVFRWGFGNIPIDRSNRERAKTSLKHLARAVVDYGRSVAISPEGTRSKSGLLQDFKKGPFYLQSDAGAPITPAIVIGAYELWPPARVYTLPGKCLVRYLPQYHVDPTKSRNANRLALRRIYLAAGAAPVPTDLSSHSDLPHLLLHIWLVASIWAFIPSTLWSIFSWIAYVNSFFGLSTFGTIKLLTTVIAVLEGVMFYSC